METRRMPFRSPATGERSTKDTGAFSIALFWGCLVLLLAAASSLLATTGAAFRVPTAGQAGGRAPATSASSLSQNGLQFNPPALDDAPEDLRPAVLYGHQIITQTRKTVPQYVGNELDCTNCHFDGGMTQDGLTLVGVAAVYPQYRKRECYSVDLTERVNNCFERSENGTRLPSGCKEMQAIMAYLQWISKGIPIYADVPWLGLKPVESGEPANPEHGKQVYAAQCSACHGGNGQGTKIAPPLWGNESFNDGAGMARLDTAAAFVHAHMPRGKPDLTPQQALNVAAYMTLQPRPHFRARPACADPPQPTTATISLPPENPIRPP
jgi:thiosulfate dehydrogenase